MARDANGVITYEQQKTEQFTTSGAVLGPFAGAGVEAVAVFVNFSSGAGGTGNITLQRAGEGPRTVEAGINWLNVSSLSATGTIQSGLSIASLYRVVVNVASGGVSVSWVAGSRSI
jgi:hypothetical protein